MPFNRRMDKENVVHIHNGVLCSRENNDIMKFAGKWMELENVILSEGFLPSDLVMALEGHSYLQCLCSEDIFPNSPSISSYNEILKALIIHVFHLLRQSYPKFVYMVYYIDRLSYVEPSLG
ncbi:hypothetical protein STEG23_026335 [Scotinomys teguina]